MRYHKLKAGECPGTYVVTEPVTEQDPDSYTQVAP